MRQDQAYTILKDDSYRSFGMIEADYQKMLGQNNENKARAEDLWKAGNFTGAIESMVRKDTFIIEHDLGSRPT